MRTFDTGRPMAAQLVYSADSRTLAANTRENYRVRLVWLWEVGGDSAQRLRFDPADYHPLLTYDEVVTGRRVVPPPVTLPRRTNYRSNRVCYRRAADAPVFGWLARYYPSGFGPDRPTVFTVRVLDPAGRCSHPPIEWESTRYPVGEPQLALDADGSRAAVAAGTRIRVWRVASAEVLASLSHRRQVPASCAFSADGRKFGVLFQDAVWLYDTITWRVATTLRCPIGRLRTLAFAPDGTTAAASSDRGKVVVFDLE